MIYLHKLPGQALQSLSCFTHLHVSRSRSCSWSWSPEGPHRSLVVLHHIKWPAKKKIKLWKQEKLCTSESNPCFKNWEKKKNLWHIPKHPFIQIVASSLVRRWPEIIRLWESVWWAIWIWGVIYKRRGDDKLFVEVLKMCTQNIHPLSTAYTQNVRHWNRTIVYCGSTRDSPLETGDDKTLLAIFWFWAARFPRWAVLRRGVPVWQNNKVTFLYGRQSGKRPVAAELISISIRTSSVAFVSLWTN